MLRPATPLTILFLAAFILLLLSALSTPLIKTIPLGSYQGFTFGAWGYCQGSRCSSLRIGYSTDGLFADPTPNGDFALSSSTRSTLSKILVIHPVAAFLGLICTALAIASHFRAPSHSPRYLLGLIMLAIPTLLVSLLAVVVDILLFTPHVSWGGWLGLASSACIFISLIVTCFMRRTLVGRKARRKRIADNAEMNGQTYFESRQAEIAAGTVATLPRAESPPPLSGSSISPGYEKTAPTVAAFDLNHQRGSDDRIPLNPMGGPPSRAGSEYNSSPRRDQYGNALPPPPNVMGGQLRNVPSNGSLRSQQSSRGGSMYNGRGGRGGYGPGPGPGPGPMRGGYGPPRGGGYGPRGGPQGMRGPPPPGWNGNGRGRGGMGGPPPGNMMGRGGGPGNYQNRFYQDRDQGYGPSPMQGGPMPALNTNFASAANQGPIGQAMELDERHGLPSPVGGDAAAAGMVPLAMPRMPSDPVAHREDITSPSSDYSNTRDPEPYMPPRAQWASKPLNRQLSPIQASPSSSAQSPRPHRQSSEMYIEDVDPQFAAPIPPTASHQGLSIGAGAPLAAAAAAGATGMTAISMHHTRQPSYGRENQHHANQQPHRQYSGGPHHQNRRSLSRDGAGMPGPNVAMMKSSPTLTKFLSPSDPNLHHGDHTRNIANFSGSNESLPEGQRSPAESEGSHFTSVSQRGVNPNWRPGPGHYQGGGPPFGNGRSGPPGGGQGSRMAGGGGGSGRNNDDILLNSNPDFTLPGMSPPRHGPPVSRARGMSASGGGGARAGGSSAGLAGPGGGRMPAPMQGPGMMSPLRDMGPMGAAGVAGSQISGAGGRYPGP